MTSVPTTHAVQTLGDVLKDAARRSTGSMTFHLDDGVRRVGVEEIHDMASERAAVLLAHGVGRGDRIGLVGPNHPEWLGWAWATWLAGATLVPLPAPLRVRDPAAFREQIRSLTSAMQCRLVVSHPRFLGVLGDDKAIDWTARTNGSAGSGSAGAATADDTAVIICTSGSTALPKGIARSHAQVLASSFLSQLNETLLREPALLIWLPFSHSAGLRAVLGPPMDGLAFHVVPTERFARDPGAWLRAVGVGGATVTWGPSSAWAAAARAVSRDARGVDLSTLESAVFTFEMVDPATVERVREVCAPLGLDPAAMGVAYGLSEGGATMTRPGTGIRIDRVDLTELVSSGRAVPAAGGRPAKCIASCGAPISGMELLIGSPDAPRADREIGEILFRGRSVMEGYVGGDGQDPFVRGWLRTGDIGYLADGELFVTGRSKEIIVHFGRNYHPEDLEWAAARVPGVGPGGCAAFVPEGAAEGEVVVVVESSGEADPADLETRVRRAVGAAVGLVPSTVVIVPENVLPRTANGKLQRRATAAAFARGELAPPAN